MKGVSIIISTVLLLMVLIVISIFAFQWFIKVGSTISNEGNKGITNFVNQTTKMIGIESIGFVGNNTMVYVRNKGSSSVAASELRLYSGSTYISCNWSSGSIAPNAVTSCNVSSNLCSGTVGLIKVTTISGEDTYRCSGSVPRCGNWICEAFETCLNCGIDCCTNPATCNNGQCEASETCSNCPQDCGACTGCGDGSCNGNETCSTCGSDCGACVSCGDGSCNGNETCSSCSSDCGACVVCGDGNCNGNETCSTCSADCGACTTCGNSVCDSGETCSNCWGDCGRCPITWFSHGYGSAGQITVVAIDQAEPNRVYIGCDVAGIFKSTDGGGTWQFAVNGLGGYYVAGLKVDPLNHAILYAYTNNGTFKSTNFGDSWSKLSDSVIASSSGRDGDHGTSAMNIGLKGGQLDFYVYSNMSVYAGVYRSSNGILWSRMSTPIDGDGTADTSFNDLAVDPKDREHLFVGTERGLYESTDGGSTWKRHALEFVYSKDISYIGFSRGDSSHVYVMNYRGELFRSERSGTDLVFSVVATTLASAGNSYRAAYVDTNPNDANEDIIYITRRGGGQGGAFAWAFDIKTNQLSPIGYYSGSNKNIVYPENWYGINWKAVTEIGGTNSIDVDLSAPFASRKLIVSSGRMLTGQNTGSWQWSMKVKGIENYEVYDAKFDSNNPSIIYAADLDSGIIKSADGGKTWLRKDNGMNPYVSNCVSTSTYNCMAQGDAAYVEVAPSDNPAQPSIVFSSINHWSSSSSNDRLLPSNPYRSFQDKYGITSAGCRIFKSMDGGETWADKSNGLPPPCSTTNGATNSMIWKIIYNKKGNLLFLTQKRVPINDQECQDVRHPSTSCSTAEMSNNLYPPVYMSRDLGETWQALPEAGLPDGSYSRNGLGYDEGTGELFYGVYNSIDGTKGLYKIKPLTETSWTKLTINQPSFDTKSITDMYTKNNRIYLGYKSSGYGFRLLISQDNGNSWTLGNGGNYFTDGKMNSAEGFISVDPNDISHVFVTFNNWWSKPNMGVFESIDGGQTFTQRNQGLDFTDVYHITFHPTDPNKLLLLATGGGGLFWSYVP